MKKLLLIAVILLYAFMLKAIEKPSFKYGFGVGLNFSHISEINSFALYEDISGNLYQSEYSPLLKNFGNQYFFHGEFQFQKLIIALKPGTYTYKFSKTDEIVFTNETLEESTDYILRYFKVPLELKYKIGGNKFMPFFGGTASYAHLLGQSGNDNQSFIHPLISVGGIAGAYYSVPAFDIVFSAGYDYNFHIITKKSDRFEVSTDSPFSQSDLKLNNIHVEISLLFAFDQTNLKRALECRFPNKKSKKP